MQSLKPEQTVEVGGGLEPRQYDTQVAPEPAPGVPLVVVDYNPPLQPQ